MMHALHQFQTALGLHSPAEIYRQAGVVSEQPSRIDASVYMPLSVSSLSGSRTSP